MIGYGKNIVKLATEEDFQAPYGSEVVRCVGVVIPVIGAVAGYMDLHDTKQ